MCTMASHPWLHAPSGKRALQPMHLAYVFNPHFPNECPRLVEHVDALEVVQQYISHHLRGGEGGAPLALMPALNNSFPVRWRQGRPCFAHQPAPLGLCTTASWWEMMRTDAWCCWHRVLLLARRLRQGRVAALRARQSVQHIITCATVRTITQHKA